VRWKQSLTPLDAVPYLDQQAHYKLAEHHITTAEELLGQIEATPESVRDLLDMSDPDVIGDRERYATAGRAYAQLEPAARLAEQWRLAKSDLDGAQELEAQEAGRRLDLGGPLGETLLERRAHALGHLDGVDLDDAHERGSSSRSDSSEGQSCSEGIGRGTPPAPPTSLSGASYEELNSLGTHLVRIEDLHHAVVGRTVGDGVEIARTGGLEGLLRRVTLAAPDKDRLPLLVPDLDERPGSDEVPALVEPTRRRSAPT